MKRRRRRKISKIGKDDVNKIIIKFDNLSNLHGKRLVVVLMTIGCKSTSPPRLPPKTNLVRFFSGFVERKRFFYLSAQSFQKLFFVIFHDFRATSALLPLMILRGKRSPSSRFCRSSLCSFLPLKKIIFLIIF